MVECEKTDRHKKKKFESSLLKSRPAIIRANKKQVQMCSRVVSRLGLKRDFTQEPSFFFLFSLSLHLRLPFFWALLAQRIHCFAFVSHASMQVFVFTDKQTRALSIRSLWAQAWIFLTWCAFSPPHAGCMVSLKLLFDASSSVCLAQQNTTTWTVNMFTPVAENRNKIENN